MVTCTLKENLLNKRIKYKITYYTYIRPNIKEQQLVIIKWTQCPNQDFQYFGKEIQGALLTSNFN